MSITPGIFNVLDPIYGAAGDGVADDTAPIQLAINAAYTSGGGIVYLPKGRYLIDGNMTTLQRPPDGPGGDDGTYVGTTSIPFMPGTAMPPVPYPLVPPLNANNGVPDGMGVPTMLPNGPLLLFDNVTLQGDGPDITVILAGENIYGGYMLAPSLSATGGSVTQSGVLIASVNWWADYLTTADQDPNPFSDGFYAHNVFIKDLSIDCQGKLAPYAGMPLQLIDTFLDASVPNPNVHNGVDGRIVGQLTGAAIVFQDVQGCGISNVWIYDAAVNGILIVGTQNLNAHSNGPITQSYEQQTGTVLPLHDLEAFISNADYPAEFGTPSSTNVPFLNASIVDCRVDLNYPVWLAGTRPEGGHGYTGGSDGNLPIRCVGGAGILLSKNRIGQRNKPSMFEQFTTPIDTINFPNVAPNTDDGMDCPGCWHIAITSNIITNCGDGIGAAGNGNMIVANNVLYNFGSNGVDMVAPSNPHMTAKGPSQMAIVGNVFFLSADSGSPQQAINYSDLISTESGMVFGSGNTGEQASSQQGCLVIANNVFYASNISTFCSLSGWGIIVTGNIFDYAGNTPNGQPLASAEYMMGDATGTWPAPKGSGIIVTGNDIIIEGNLFRNAGPPPTPNDFAIGIQFPASFPPPLVTGDTVRVLIKGNSFDPTIGVPIHVAFTDTSYGLPRVIDNIGANPGATLAPAIIAVVPTSNTPFMNPYIYDCFVNVTPVGSTVTVKLNGAPFGSIPLGQQRAFLVKAGGSITLGYTGAPDPIWVWVAL